MAPQRYGFVNLRVETGSGSAVRAHNEGETRPREALGRPEYQDRAVIPLRDSAESQARAEALLESCDAIPRRGKRGARRMFVLIGGPPPFESAETWSKQKVDEWASHAVDFVDRAIGKDAVIESANMHVDERSPHVHVTVIPAIRDGRGPKLSARGVQRRMGGFPDAGKDHGSVVLRALQDRFYKEVSEPYALGRKRPDAPQRREPPDRVQGLADRLADTQRQVAALERRDRARSKATAKLEAAKRRMMARMWTAYRRYYGAYTRLNARDQAKTRG